MAYSSSIPFYNSPPPAAAPRSAPNPKMTLDNLLRRELGISNAEDPREIADALVSRYRDNPRTRGLMQEEKGLPFLTAPPPTPVQTMVPTASGAEIRQAVDDVHRDIEELVNNSLLKDVAPELRGWEQAIRTAMIEGPMAARQALDARQRDKAFSIRRQLGDYARLARLVGALTPHLNFPYRAFAQSLDEVAALILVLMGEALANVGFAAGRYLLQAPYSELQLRRDAVIYALRNLVGSTQEAFGPNDWPRGLDGYRRLLFALEEQGQGDLRIFLTENELARMLEELIQRAANGSIDGLRALGGTAQVDLQRVRRIIAVGSRLVTPESPPLTAFLESLQLFLDGFESGGGFRLLRIARPPILLYGLYGSDEIEPADRRLLQLSIRRGTLAGKLDCVLRCDCSSDAVKCQIMLDKVLYDIDRAIDLYALGSQDLGLPELRAAAYSYVIDAVIGTGCPDILMHATPTIAGTLTALRGVLRPIQSPSGQPPDPGLVDWAQASVDQFDDTVQANRNLLVQELCIQRDAEQHWEETVATMAPSCIPITELFGRGATIMDTINAAIGLVLNGTSTDEEIEEACGTFEPTIPPHFETTLANKAFARLSNGQDGTANLLEAIRNTP